jgi:hypothetical protein
MGHGDELACGHITARDAMTVFPEAKNYSCRGGEAKST